MENTRSSSETTPNTEWYASQHYGEREWPGESLARMYRFEDGKMEAKVIFEPIEDEE